MRQINNDLPTITIEGQDGHRYIVKLAERTLTARCKAMDYVWLLYAGAVMDTAGLEAARAWIDQWIPMSSPLV